MKEEVKKTQQLISAPLIFWDVTLIYEQEAGLHGKLGLEKELKVRIESFDIIEIWSALLDFTDDIEYMVVESEIVHS